MKTTCAFFIWTIFFTTGPSITNQAKFDQTVGQNFYSTFTKDGKMTINTFFGPTPPGVLIIPSQQTPSQDRIFKKKAFLLGYLSSSYLNSLFSRGQSMLGLKMTTTPAPTPAPVPPSTPPPMPAPAHGGYYQGGGHGSYGGHGGYGGHSGYGSYSGGYGGYKEETTTTTEATTTTTRPTQTTPELYKHRHEKYEYDYDYYEDDRYCCESYYYECDYYNVDHHKYRRYEK